MDTALQAIPGVVVVLLGVLCIVGRNVLGWSNSFARAVIAGRTSTRSERRGDTVLPIVIGVGLVVAGFWLLVHTYVIR